MFKRFWIAWTWEYFYKRDQCDFRLDWIVFTSSESLTFCQISVFGSLTGNSPGTGFIILCVYLRVELCPLYYFHFKPFIFPFSFSNCIERSAKKVEKLINTVKVYYIGHSVFLRSCNMPSRFIALQVQCHVVKCTAYQLGINLSTTVLCHTLEAFPTM